MLSSLLISSYLIHSRTLCDRNIFTFYRRGKQSREVNLPKVTKHIKDVTVSDSEVIPLTTTLHTEVQTQETQKNKNIHVYNYSAPRQHCSHFDIFHSGFVCFCFHRCLTLHMILYPIYPILIEARSPRVE